MMKNHRQWLRRAAVLSTFTTIITLTGLASHAAELRVLSSWNTDSFAVYQPLAQFKINVEKLSGGSTTLKINGPEVIPPFEQLEPVSAGVYDILFTHGAYHAGSKGIALVADAIKPDVEARRESGVWGSIDKFYQAQNNMKLLALVPMSTQGFHFILREPLSDNSDLKGRRIRGTASYHGVIDLLGASPVALPTSEMYSGLEKGVVDGAANPAAGMLTLKLYEVANYRTRPTFGSTNLPILINLDKWNSLSKEEQEVLAEAGLKTELEMPAIGDQIQADEDKELDAKGVKYTEFTPERHAEIAETWNSSVWKLGNKCCGDAAKELRALAKKAGLSN